MTDETTRDAELDTPVTEGIDPVGTEAEAAVSSDVASEDVARESVVPEEPRAADTPPDDVAGHGVAPPSPRRGSIAIYAAAFGLMVLAAVCLMIGALGILSIVNVAETSFFGTQRILRISAVLSGLAIVAAIVALLVPRRSA